MADLLEGICAGSSFYGAWKAHGVPLRKLRCVVWHGPKHDVGCGLVQCRSCQVELDCSHVSAAFSSRGENMKMHETLYFIQRLHDFIEEGASKKGPWCWPTRDVLAENVDVNIEILGKNARADMRRQMGIARRRGWIDESGCVAHCHALHVKLTAAGREALRLMNESGCCPSCGRPKAVAGDRDCVTSLKFVRDLAA